MKGLRWMKGGINKTRNESLRETLEVVPSEDNMRERESRLRWYHKRCRPINASERRGI